jgi:hypothetical protein
MGKGGARKKRPAEASIEMGMLFQGKMAVKDWISSR